MTLKEKASGPIQPTAAEVKRVLKLRKDGLTWREILAKLDKPGSFVHAVRPLMKKVDPSSVAPSYDRKATKSAKTRVIGEHSDSNMKTYDIRST